MTQKFSRGISPSNQIRLYRAPTWMKLVISHTRSPSFKIIVWRHHYFFEVIFWGKLVNCDIKRFLVFFLLELEVTVKYSYHHQKIVRHHHKLFSYNVFDPKNLPYKLNPNVERLHSKSWKWLTQSLPVTKYHDIVPRYHSFSGCKMFEVNLWTAISSRWVSWYSRTIAAA